MEMERRRKREEERKSTVSKNLRWRKGAAEIFCVLGFSKNIRWRCVCENEWFRSKILEVR